MSDKPVDPAAQWRDVRAKAADGRVVGSAIPCVAGDALCSAYECQRLELERYRTALEKIDAIRNSIVGRQSVHWSMHIYPLVAALGEAGFAGEGYEVAHAKAVEEVAALNAAIALRSELDAACIDRDAAIARVEELLAEHEPDGRG